VRDFSSNGTLLAGKLKLLPTGIKTRLYDGDELGILWTKSTQGQFAVQFGLRFNTFEITEGENTPEQPDEYEANEEDDSIVDYDYNETEKDTSSKSVRKYKRKLKGPSQNIKKPRTNVSLSPKRKPVIDGNDLDNTIEKSNSTPEGEKEEEQEEEEEELSGKEGRFSEDRTKHNKTTDDSPVSAKTDEDRRGKLWTPEEDKKLRDLVIQIQPKEPQDWSTIASLLGRTVKSCKHKFIDHGLHFLIRTEDEQNFR